MPSMTIQTCGLPSKQRFFNYRGNSTDGIILEYPSGNRSVPREVIDNLLNRYEGGVMLGASMTNPVEGGVGEFISMQQVNLTPRHASHIIGVLFHEERVEINHRGNAVEVIFPIR